MKLEKIARSLRGHGEVFEPVLYVESTDGGFAWSAREGAEGASYYAASITKTFTAAAIMLLREQGRLRLDDPILNYLEAERLAGIHVYRGRDYLKELRVHHLLSQTSGLADYFEGKTTAGESLLTELAGGTDRTWDLEDVLEMVRAGMKPNFPPDDAPALEMKKARAAYSDTNYQLLGAILKNVMGKNLGGVFAELIFDPLELSDTWVFGDDHRAGQRAEPAALYHGKAQIKIPGAMASFGADGAIVSTAREQIKFLRGFMDAEPVTGRGLFKNGETLNLMKRWNRIFFPLEYGYGLMRFKLPRVFSPFKAVPEFIGHSGASGSFLFHCPEREILIAGTVNQLRAPSLPFRLLPRIAAAFG